MADIIKGDELMIFQSGSAMAYATSHTLTINGNTTDISSKDHGFWGASEIGNITWEATTENLYTENDYDSLFDAMLNKTEIEIVFGYASNYDPNGLKPADSSDSSDTRPSAWTQDNTKGYKGKAIITNLVANANTGENATFSATFTGRGAIMKLTASTPAASGSGAGN